MEQIIESSAITTVTRYENDRQLIGRRYCISTTAGYRWIGEAHDWGNGAEHPIENGCGYDPIILGVYEDPDEIDHEIERRAREAQTSTQRPGHHEDRHWTGE